MKQESTRTPPLVQINLTADPILGDWQILESEDQVYWRVAFYSHREGDVIWTDWDNFIGKPDVVDMDAAIEFVRGRAGQKLLLRLGNVEGL